ncbi:hypothetical protein [Rhizobacter sp. OV335]|uniref:hypothetical protein n=1 Tax=Rhizobacter sp. OV335 TaxID=1500264 RepID=UPI0011610902|nr:hypothetical protein [Rhizobacter sp. OV335]
MTLPIVLSLLALTALVAVFWFRAERVRRTHPTHAASQELPGMRTEAAPLRLDAPDVPPFALQEHMGLVDGLPFMDWRAAHAWIDGIADESERQRATEQAQRAWLLHLRDAFGDHFRLYETEQAWVLSSLENRVVLATAAYVARTRERVSRVLGRLAGQAAQQRSIVLVMDHDEDYYAYVACYYPDQPADGEVFAFSGGMFVHAGCPHFLVKRADLTAIEPVIAHEMTHSALAHLHLPTWLDEGLAVNTEHRLTGTPRLIYTPHELQRMHERFWGEAEVQQFWSGRSFHRPDDGNLLSYELARILVRQLSRDWPLFERFALAVSQGDAGAGAAREVLGIELGSSVAALMHQPHALGWSPEPARWEGPARTGSADEDVEAGAVTPA